MNERTYRVLAIRDSAFAQIEAVETFDYPGTPFYLAHDMMRDWFPRCRIQIVTPRWWQETEALS